MATKPTREQQRAGDLLAEALHLITQAARLDGKSPLDRGGFAEIVRRVAAVSSALSADAIVARALERRATDLGLGRDAVELLTLLETDVNPRDLLLLDDDAVHAVITRLQEELGEV